MGVMAIVKLLFGYYQVLVLIGSVYSVPYPPEYLAVLQMFTKIFSFDPFAMFPLECVQRYDFLYPFYSACIGCMFLLAAITGLQFLKRCFSARQTLGIQNVQGALLFITYFIYSSSCATISKIFKCVDIRDGNVLLAEDYTIHCSSGRYNAAYTFGVVATGVVSLGTPLLYGALMFPHKANIRAVQHLKFFYQDYTDDCWFWEIVECLKRFSLTGASLFLFPGTLLQIICSIILVLMYAILVGRVRPFAVAAHNTQAVLANYMLVFSLFLALLLKISVGFTSNGLYDVGLPKEIFPYLLIGSLLAVLLAYALMFVCDWVASNTVVGAIDRDMRGAFIFRDHDKSMQRSAHHGVVIFSLDEPTGDHRALRLAVGFVRRNEAPFDQNKTQARMHLCRDPTLKVSKIAVVQSSKRFQSFVNKYLEYDAKYSSNPIFRMTWLLEQSNTKLLKWRMGVIEHIGRFPTYGPSSGDWSCGEVRVCVAFRGECSEEVALSILHGNLSNLAARDPGYYGTGLYFSLDPEYCLRYYGTDKDGKAYEQRVLAIYAVVFGNAYPVTEGITEDDRAGVEKAKQIAQEKNADINYCSQDSLLGRALKAKADSHVVVVGIDGSHPETTKGTWRKMAAGHRYHGHAFQAPVDLIEQEKASGLVRSELVLRDESQVMPIGYMVITGDAPTPMCDALASNGANLPVPSSGELVGAGHRVSKDEKFVV